LNAHRITLQDWKVVVWVDGFMNTPAFVTCVASPSRILSCATSRSKVLAPWFLVHTKPASEAKAQDNLERQGYRIYYPRLQQPRLRAGRWSDRVAALFPRYLFLQLSAGQSLAPVRSTLGVAAIVRFGADYAAVPHDVVEDLLRREDPVAGLHRLNRDRSFRSGAAVRVIAGAFAELDAVFEREVGDDRVVVLLSVLGQHARVQVPTQFVVPQVGRG
jgi:transcriptional antiterminator RfaH